MNESEVADNINYESKYIEVLGSKIHYLEEGLGDPILFVHTIPTSSYVWRHLIPHLSKYGRCIAPDLIGTGKSDKPDLAYNIFDYVRYFEAFVKALDLKKITLIVHGWGSVMGFHYAAEHQANIKALVFFESYVRPDTEYAMVPLPVQELIGVLKADEKRGFEHVMESSDFVERLIGCASDEPIPESALACYKASFDKPADRKLIWQYIKDLPTGEGKTEVTNLIDAYSKKLAASTFPKLMLYAVPGFNTTMDTIQWVKNHYTNLNLVDLGEAMHYPQESKPKEVAGVIREFLGKLCFF